MRVEAIKRSSASKVHSGRASGARLLAELRSVLSKKGALQMPPIAVRNGANEESSSVKWVAGGHAKAVSSLRSDIEKKWTETYGSTRAADPIAWQELKESYSS